MNETNRVPAAGPSLQAKLQAECWNAYQLGNLRGWLLGLICGSSITAVVVGLLWIATR